MNPSRLRDGPSDAMTPIVQELRELASVADGRFTANLKEQNVKMPRIVLSPHDKPQIISLMTTESTLKHASALSREFGSLEPMKMEENMAVHQNNNNEEEQDNSGKVQLSQLFIIESIFVFIQI